MYSKMYEIQTSKLTDLVGGSTEILCEFGVGNSYFRSFYITINFRIKDDGLKFFRNKNDDEPYMTMGYADDKFYITVALLISVGELIE